MDILITILRGFAAIFAMCGVLILFGFILTEIVSVFNKPNWHNVALTILTVLGIAYFIGYAIK